ncbi:MAG TPA: FadR/GntR family transcriptional regulator [Woeseiaceae bacterium]|nr:FadR/GntR family transcriptional regulator [Woeseiaceae bacterium]
MRPPGSKAHNLTYGIVEQLGLAIVTGAYGPRNEFPTEAALCAQFGVSRSILREAVKMLTAKGLLAARPRQGTRIEPEEYWNLLDPDVLRWLLEREFSLTLLKEFTQVRLAIEPMAAAVAADRDEPEAIEPIRNAIANMYAAEDGLYDPLAADIEFHVAVLRASGNRFFLELRDLIESALRISIRLTHQYKAAGNIQDHKRILDAIEAGNPKKARRDMEALLTEVMELIILAGARSKKPKGTRAPVRRRAR